MYNGEGDDNAIFKLWNLATDRWKKNKELDWFDWDWSPWSDNEHLSCGCDVSDIAVYPYDPIRGGNNMRDANRIDRFCDELKAIWHCVPDWRFGQLMSNMLGAYVGETGKDIFFPEDDEMFEFFAKYVHGNSPLVKPE